MLLLPNGHPLSKGSECAGGPPGIVMIFDGPRPQRLRKGSWILFLGGRDAQSGLSTGKLWIWRHAETGPPDVSQQDFYWLSPLSGTTGHAGKLRMDEIDELRGSARYLLQQLVDLRSRIRCSHRQYGWRRVTQTALERMRKQHKGR